jgi:C4-type Zn-finger protein
LSVIFTENKIQCQLCRKMGRKMKNLSRNYQVYKFPHKGNVLAESRGCRKQSLSTTNILYPDMCENVTVLFASINLIDNNQRFHEICVVSLVVLVVAVA